MVHHVKRAEPYGDTRPWQTVSKMPASHARKGWNEARVGAQAMSDSATAIPVNLPSPVCRLGSRRARTGPRATRPLSHAACVCHTAPGKLSQACEGEWTGRRGRAWMKPRGPWKVADGASESEDGNAVHPGKMPLGAGPSPSGRPAQRSPANAQAVHGRTPVELEKWEGTLRDLTETD